MSTTAPLTRRQSIAASVLLTLAIVLPLVAFFKVKVPFAPIVGDDAATTTAGAPVNITVLMNDADPDGTLDLASLVVVKEPEHGIATANPKTGVFTYHPHEGFTGHDRFHYRICDNRGVQSGIGFVNVTVTPPVTP